MNEVRAGDHMSSSDVRFEAAVVQQLGNWRRFHITSSFTPYNLQESTTRPISYNVTSSPGSKQRGASQNDVEMHGSTKKCVGAYD